MKVLIVCSGNTSDTFVREQTDALQTKGIQIVFFYIKGKGLKGYFKSFRPLLNEIKKIKPDIIHAHYGLSGILANMQRKKPVVVTYHGSDINILKLRVLSSFALLSSAANIFVSNKQYKKVKWFIKFNCYLIPCGINLNHFKVVDKKNSNTLPAKNKTLNVLFASDFTTPIKNYALANAAIKLSGSKINLIELKGYNREQVNQLLNSCDLMLLTSLSEGSPQIIKEAMACNCPIVSTDVGDVKDVISQTDGCYICSFEPEDVAKKIKEALEFSKKNHRTNGRSRIIELGLDNETIADKIIAVYNKMLKNSNIN
jgi:teichuronic acid biosynthesis glycosyltransferase TuaC